jgi:hypothetical protein
MAGDGICVLGFGSLMSQASVRITMPSMRNFRYVRIEGHRRVFGHMSPLFFEAGIARAETLEISSLSAEPCEGASFCGVAFDIPREEWAAFVAREDEYVLSASKFRTLDGNVASEGMLCTSGSDQLLKERGVWPRYMASLDTLPDQTLRTCWHWAETSGLLPCACYLRHCLLSSRRDGIPDAVRQSFLDDSLLVDRKTTLREYLSRPGVEDHVMSSLPPPGLETRYGG